MRPDPEQLSLEETIQLLVKYRVQRFKGHAWVGPNDLESVELELSPLAFSLEPASSAPGGPFPRDEADRKCNCGHPLTEHSEHGLCLQACSTDVCGLGEAKT